MTDKSISPLRRRFIEDMTVRGFTPATQRGYLRAVADFTAFSGRPPDQAGAEDLRHYQLHMRSQGATATSMNAAVSALRFFFGVTLGRGDAQTGMTTVREPRWRSWRCSPWPPAWAGRSPRPAARRPPKVPEVKSSTGCWRSSPAT